MNVWLQWEIPIIIWLQSLGTWLYTPMRFFSFLGGEEFTMLVIPGILWCYDSALGLRMGLILFTSAGVNSILKLVFGWPRPSWIRYQVHASTQESSYGMPSGHAQDALVLWGRMAAVLHRRAWTISLGMLVFLISMSRLYLGVHFPSDVLGGWLVGVILLALLLTLDKPVEKWIGKQKLVIQLMIPFLASLILIGVGLGMKQVTANRVVPQKWINHAWADFPNDPPIDPRKSSNVVPIAGILFGLGGGGVFLHRWGKFSAAGSARNRIGRFVVGVVGIVLIHFGLQDLLPSGNFLLHQTLSYLHYATVGLWISYLAPWVFVRLRLA